MTNDKVKIIAEANKETVLKALKIMCENFNLKLEDIANMSNKMLQFYIQNMFHRVSVNEYKLYEIKTEIKNNTEVLDDLRRTFVSSDSYDNVAAGKNTGLKPNNVEKRHIRILELQEKIDNLVKEYAEVEENIKQKRKDIEDFIDILTQRNHSYILKLFYIQNQRSQAIASLIQYEATYVDQIRHRAIVNIAAIVKRVLKDDCNFKPDSLDIGLEASIRG